MDLIRSIWQGGRLLGAALAVVALATPASAGLQEDWRSCQNPSSAEEQITACTRILKSGSNRLQARNQAIAHNNRGNGWFLKREFDRAVADYNQSIRIDRGYAHPYGNRGNLWFEKGDLDRALADYNEALRLNPDFPEALLGRGNVLVARLQFDAALADLNRAIGLRKDFANAIFGRGNAWAGKQELDRAIRDYEAAIRLDPNHAEAFNSRGEAWRRKGEFERAVASFDEAIRLNPNVSRFYGGRATAFVEKRDFRRAELDFDVAIRVGPRLPVLFNNRGLMWRDKGDYARAMEDFNEAIRLDPKHHKAYANRGEIFRLMGDLDRALADQSQQIRLHPEEHLSYIVRGDTYRYRGEFVRALADYDDVLRDKPHDIAALTGRGLTLEKMGDRDRARSEFEKAARSQQQDRSDINGSALETARARLAALGSGQAPPVILPAPSKAASPTSLPTPSIAATILTQPLAPKRAEAAGQGRRVALVIGNSAYRRVPELINPKRDADAIAVSLRNIGFDAVTLVSDTTRERLTDILRAFANEAERADWAMVYYAGHGIEVNGQNYLVPVDAKLAADRDVQFEAVHLDQVMASLEGARKLRLVMLDACRDNPFTPQMRRTTAVADAGSSVPTVGNTATRSIGRGLGEVKVSGASLVVFAAKHGQTALDGEGGNSPFAIALVQRIATPGVEINKIFRLVRDDVMEATAGRQEPFTYGSLPGKEDFFFVAGR